MNKAFDPSIQSAVTDAVNPASHRSLERELTAASARADAAERAVQDAQAELRRFATQLETCRTELSDAQANQRAAEARATLLAAARDVAVIAARRAAAISVADEWRQQIAMLQQRAHAAEAQSRNWQRLNSALRAELLGSEQRYTDLRARLAQLISRFGRAVRLVPKPVRHYARSRIVRWSKD